MLHTYIGSSESAPVLSRTEARVRLSHKQEIRETVLRSFAELCAAQVEKQLQFSCADWKALLPWLDVSGLSLYLFDQLGRLGLLQLVPRPVIMQIERNLLDNTERTRGMIQESVAIQREFQRAGLRYVVLKGISLCPAAVPRPELRHQFDLDYLVSQPSAREAQRILERKGYRLYARSNGTLEFKRNEDPRVSKKDLYKNLSYRGVELHIEPATPRQSSRLDRAEVRQMHGMRMPVLSPVDLFLGQAMHLFKDLAGPFCRGSQFLEFYRHVLTRRDDNIFWSELSDRARNDTRQSLGLALVTYVATLLFDDFTPVGLSSWTVDCLSPEVRLWAEIYGRRSALCTPPGTKLYLLLQRQLEREQRAPGRHSGSALMPWRPPPTVVSGIHGETLPTRLARYRVQLRFILSRARFHLIEGARLAIERRRWRRLSDLQP